MNWVFEHVCKTSLLYPCRKVQLHTCPLLLWMLTWYGKNVVYPYYIVLLHDDESLSRIPERTASIQNFASILPYKYAVQYLHSTNLHIHACLICMLTVRKSQNIDISQGQCEDNIVVNFNFLYELLWKTGAFIKWTAFSIYTKKTDLSVGLAGDEKGFVFASSHVYVNEGHTLLFPIQT